MGGTPCRPTLITTKFTPQARMTISADNKSFGDIAVSVSFIRSCVQDRTEAREPESPEFRSNGIRHCSGGFCKCAAQTHAIAHSDKAIQRDGPTEKALEPVRAQALFV